MGKSGKSGNAAWQSLSDCGPQTPREIEDALALAKKGKDWRDDNQGRVERARKTKTGQRIRYEGWEFESISECARIIGKPRAAIRKRALDASDKAVRLLQARRKKS